MNEISTPPKHNIPTPPNVKTMPNVQKIDILDGDIDQSNQVVEEGETPKKGKIILNNQAKTILLAMFSGLSFLGAIACFVLMLVL